MKKLLYFLAGLIIPLILYALGGYLLFKATITFSSQTLTDRENINVLYFYCVLAGVVVFSIIAFRQFKLNRKFTCLGITLSIIPILLVLFKLCIIYFGQLIYNQPFDKPRWAANVNKPFKMAKTLVKQKDLIGLERKELIDKLGYYKETAGVDGQTLIYNTDTYWDFYIDLRQDTVVKAYLYDKGLD